jgi:glycosyltransferase involved in cell wall biosynthesis
MEGIGWFTHEVLRRMTLAHPEVEFHFFFDRPFDPSFIYGPNVTGHVVRPPVRHPWLFDWWFNVSVPRKLRRLHADVFVSMDGFCSLRTKVPQVITIHDLNFMHHPEHMQPRYRTYLPKRTRQFVESEAVLTSVSAYSAQDIQQTFDVNRPVHVVFNAASEVFRPLSPDRISEVRSRMTNGRPYFLFVSSLHPRKNLVRILLAFEASRANNEHTMPLLVVGRRFWMNQEVDQLLLKMKYRNEVIFTGNMDQKNLAELTGAAFALVYASLYEGFGIPIIEAMQCGVPVITSNVTSMPEVAGDAAILVDPYKVEEIAAAMAQLAQNDALYQRLHEASLVQAQKFDWSTSAQRYWQIISNAVVKKTEKE